MLMCNIWQKKTAPLAVSELYGNCESITLPIQSNAIFNTFGADFGKVIDREATDEFEVDLKCF